MVKIVRIMGGLGNQLFQYAMARNLSYFNDKIILDLDLESAETKRNYVLDKFNIVSFPKTTKIKSDYYKQYRKYFDGYNIINRIMKYGKERETFVFQDVSKCIYLDGYWQNRIYFNKIKDVLINEITLNDDIFIKNEILAMIEKNNSVGVHVRRGDYLNSTNSKIFENQGVEYYISAMNYVKDKIENPLFFVFSDDIAWCKKAFYNIDNIIFVDGNNTAEQDFDMLKKCKHNIISNSTFSWWAAWLKPDNCKLLIAPHNWYKNEKTNDNCLKALVEDFILF